MKNLILLLLLIIVSSCSSDDNNDQFIVATDIDISVIDNEGNDLLNPNNQNSLNTNEIKIFYDINGEQILFYDSNLTYPSGFFIYEHENEFRIRIFPNTNQNSELPITYIQWNNSDTDTIKCEIDRTNNSEICKKIWYNDELVWQGNQTERFLTIIK